MRARKGQESMSDSARHETLTGSGQNVVPLMLLVNGDVYATEAEPMAIFHEVLEHTVPAQQLKGHRIRISTPTGEEIFPDMFIGETTAHFQTHTFHIQATPLPEAAEGAANMPWTNLGFDHLAITVADRADAKHFLSEALRMTVVRDDRHQTVLTTGNTAIFCFGTEIAPLSDDQTAE